MENGCKSCLGCSLSTACYESMHICKLSGRENFNLGCEFGPFDLIYLYGEDEFHISLKSKKTLAIFNYERFNTFQWGISTRKFIKICKNKNERKKRKRKKGKEKSKL